MRYFANPSNERVRDAMRAGLLDVIQTPGQGNRPVEGVPWCADNGCFGKGYPGDEAWLAWLEKNADRADSCVFATAPDVVGDAAATIERSAPWLPVIRSLGYPAAFVAQDGLGIHWNGTLHAGDLNGPTVSWDSFDVLFIGGTDDFKLGARARSLVAEAKRRGKHVHCGRVNSLRRLQYCQSLGVDTVDGTFIKVSPDVNLPRMLRYLARVENQSSLIDGFGEVTA